MRETCFFLVLVMVGLSAIACKNIPSGTNPPPREIKTYSLEVNYTRVDVKYLGALSRYPFIYLNVEGVNRGDWVVFLKTQRLDDYHFKGAFDGVSNYRQEKYAAGFYDIAVVDDVHYDGVDRGSTIVGYKITIRVIETDFSKEFLPQKNTIYFSYESEKSTMIRVYLTNEGTVEDPPVPRSMPQNTKARRNIL